MSRTILSLRDICRNVCVKYAFFYETFWVMVCCVMRTQWNSYMAVSGVFVYSDFLNEQGRMR